MSARWWSASVLTMLGAALAGGACGESAGAPSEPSPAGALVGSPEPAHPPSIEAVRALERVQAAYGRTHRQAARPNGAPMALAAPVTAGPDQVAFERAGDPDRWLALVSPVTRPKMARMADVDFATTPAGGFRVADRESHMAIEVKLRDATDRAAEPVAGHWVYPDALPNGADLVQRVFAEGTEDYLLFESAPAETAIRYDVRLDERLAGLRLVGNTLELLDERGTPRLRVAPPTLVDAAGQVHPARLVIEGCAFDQDGHGPWGRAVTSPGASVCELAVVWPATGIEYPIVVDPAWTTTGMMVLYREPCTGGLIGTGSDAGRVLVVGGNAGNPHAAEMYDPATKTWAAAQPTQGARGYVLNAHVLNDGRILLIGGAVNSTYTTCCPCTCTNCEMSTETYDPVAAQWTSGDDLLEYRRTFASAVLPGGEVLVVGGFGAPVDQGSSCSGEPALASAEISDVQGGGWTSAGSLATGRHQTTLTALADGRALVIGGATASYTAIGDAEIYDPDDAPTYWSNAGSLVTPRREHSASLLSSGWVVVAGGDDATIFESVEYWDPNDATTPFKPLAPMDGPRLNHSAVVLPNDHVLVVGGSYSGSKPDEQLFDGVAKWSSAGQTLHSHTHAPTVILNSGEVLTAGGYSQYGELYSPMPEGSLCTGAGQCASGHCVDGVCCDTSCAGPCQGCTAALKGGGADGACGPLPAGEDPEDDCEPQGLGVCLTPGYCDGNGACASHVGEECIPSACAGTFAQLNASLCDALGNCVSTGAMSCSPFICRDGACLDTCTSNDDCVQGFLCLDDGTCAANVAVCDGDHVVTTTDGTRFDCAPYRCDASGDCKQACTSIDDCATPYVCDTAGHCGPQDGAADEGDCGCRAAGRPTPERRLGAWALALAVGLLRRGGRRSPRAGPHPR